jgi:hypothetical protein
MKFPAVESVVPRVSQQTPKHGIGVKGRIDFLEIKTAPISEDAGDFLQPQVPLLQVMDDSEIEHGIERAIPIRKVLGIGDKEGRPLANGGEGFSKSKLDHGWIDVYGVNPFGIKILTYESCAVASSAADF